MRETRGAIVFARKIIDSEIFLHKPDKWFKIWTFILISCNFKDNGKFKKGECFTTYGEICSYTKATRNEVDHCIRWLKSATQIATRRATRGLFIKVVNYEIYQNISTYRSDTKSDTKSDLKAIGRRQRGDTIKNNENNENNDIPIFSLSNFLIITRSSSKRYIKIIGEYADEIKPTYTTKDQWDRFLEKNITDAKNLSKYTDEQITNAFVDIQSALKSDANPNGYLTRWTLKTLEKYI